MISFFYIFFSIFIWNEIYYFYNRKRLDTNFKNKEIESITLTEFFFYFTRLLMWIFILIGLFIDPLIFSILLCLKLFKFLLYHINIKIFFVYDAILPIISSIYILLLIIHFIR
jgi:hypothetical protein